MERKRERELCMYMSVCLSSERVSNGKGLCFPKLVVAPLVMPSFPSLLLYVLIVCSRGNERGEMERTEHGACVESKDGGERERLLSVCAPLKIFTTATAKKEDKLARLSFPHDAVIKNECRRSKNSRGYK